MNKVTQNKLKAFLLGASALALLAEPVSAGYIQTLGIGQKTSSLAGATTAIADDFDAFYVNPAGAANFSTPVIGLAVKLIDTTGLEVNDGANAGVKDTFKGEALALAPGLGAYLPVVPGSIVMGLGVAAPYALGADFEDQPFGATVTNNSSTNVELLYIEATPTVAVKVNERLNIGFGINIGLAKHLKITTKFDNLAGTNVAGVIQVHSDDDMPLPVAPWEFSTDPTAVTFTVGMQYKLMPNLAMGVVYREETPNSFEGGGHVLVQTNLGLACNTIGGPLNNCGGPETFNVKLEMPRHIQFGLAWQAMENWELSFDVQWTNWAEATGWGSPAIVDLRTSQANPNLAFGAGGAGVQGLLCQAGICGVNQLVIPYDARDAMTYRVGSNYQLNETVALLGGYAFDEQVHPNHAQDLNSYSSDRHHLTGGVELTMPTPLGLAKLNLGGQIIFYEDNTINSSKLGGGLGPTAQVGAQQPSGALGEPQQIVYGPLNNPYSTGGQIWTVGMGATIFFGATEAPSHH